MRAERLVLVASAAGDIGYLIDADAAAPAAYSALCIAIDRGQVDCVAAARALERVARELRRGRAIPPWRTLPPGVVDLGAWRRRRGERSR